MTVLAIRLANITNGVSKLHGKVSRKMWKAIWPELPEAEIPDHLDHQRRPHPQLAGAGNVAAVRPLSGHSVGRTADRSQHLEARRQHPRRRAVAHPRTPPRTAGGLRPPAAARRSCSAAARRPAEIARADEVLDPEALTIGFARRFATYKRGTLIFRNLDRLAAIINNKDRPVQIIFAGKAHPRDHGGKELIAEIIHICPPARVPPPHRLHRRLRHQRGPLPGAGRGRLAEQPAPAAGSLGHQRHEGLLQRRPQPVASSTAGGCEGYAGDNGWAIGAGEEYTDLTYQDDVESRAIYDLLEQEIVPLFYTRSSDGLPRGWLKVMKRSMSTVCPVFNTNRMVQEYMEKCYWPVGRALQPAGRRQPEGGRRRWRSGGAAWRRAGRRSASRRSRPTAPTRCTSARSSK